MWLSGRLHVAHPCDKDFWIRVIGTDFTAELKTTTSSWLLDTTTWISCGHLTCLMESIYSPQTCPESSVNSTSTHTLVIPVWSQGIISVCLSSLLLIQQDTSSSDHIPTLSGPSLPPPLFRSSSFLSWFATVTSSPDSLIHPSFSTTHPLPTIHINYVTKCLSKRLLWLCHNPALYP